MPLDYESIRGKIALFASIAALLGTAAGFVTKHSEPAEKVRNIESWESQPFEWRVRDIVNTSIHDANLVTVQDMNKEHEVTETEIASLVRGQDKIQRDLDKVLAMEIDQLKEQKKASSIIKRQSLLPTKEQPDSWGVGGTAE
jgi:hypothetical protein